MKKAIINFFRAILKRNIVMTPTEGQPFMLLVVDEKSDTVSGSLGISDERAQELGTACDRAFITSRDTVEAMNKVNHMCNHINEVFFCTTVIIGQQSRAMNPIMGLLSALGRPKD
jgi:hypothetical protein